MCIMSVKNLVGFLGVHDKMDYTLEFRSLSLGQIIRKSIRVTPFCKNVLTIWDQHRGALKPNVLIPRSRLQRVSQGVSLLIQVKPRKYFNTHRLYL